MNDQDLVELVQRKPPEDLTPDELQSLQQRLQHSAELRSAVLSQLRLEECLHQKLGKANVSLDLIFNHREPPPDSRGGGFVSLLALLLCLAFGALVVILIITSQSSGVDDQDVAQATTLQRPETEDAERAADASAATESTGPDEGVTTDESEGQSETSSATPSADDSAARVLPVVIEAEKFTAGNISADSTEFGDEQTTVIHNTTSPAFAEYEVDLPVGGELELLLRYAAFDSRPLNLTINGKTVPGFVAGEQTGGNLAEHQQWISLGQFEFIAGKNSIRFDTPARFPLVDQLQIANPAPPDALADAGKPDLPARAEPTKEAADEPPMPIEPPPEQTFDPNRPWVAVLTNPAEPPAFDEVCFKTFDTSKSLPQVEDLKKWFAPVPGQPANFFKQGTSIGESGWIEGLVQLQAPLDQDAALRLWLESYNRLRIHLFNGTEGVTLVFYQDYNYRWEAYATTRQPDAPQPETFVFVASDDNRNSRTEIRHGGPFELRHFEGEIFVNRGDVMLLRAPMEKPPEQVFFEGKTAFHGIELHRTKDYPAKGLAQMETTPLPAPAELPWIEQLHQRARFTRLADGGIELTANQSDRRGWVSTPSPYRGMHELIFRIEEATPGTGVFVAPENGSPQMLLLFVRNNRDGGLCLINRGQDDYVEGDHGLLVDRPVPFARSNLWLKMLVGGGALRWWTSYDGLHWAAPVDTSYISPGSAWHMGVYHVGGQPDLRIKIRDISVRPLQELESLAAADLLTNARSFHALGDWATWSKAVDETCPDKTEQDDWRMACAVRSLATGANSQMSRDLLTWILERPEVQALPLGRQRRLLDEASLIIDSRNQNFQLEMVKRYHQLAVEAHLREDRRPFTWIRRDIVNAPFSYRHRFPVGHESTVRSELLHLLYDRQWREVEQFCRRLRFYHLHHEFPLVEWAELAAADAQHGYANIASGRRSEWIHPLDEELSKEAYNVAAELRAVLDSEAYDDAAKMIASLDAHAYSGVAPSGSDSQLYVALPSAIKLALRQHAPLRAAMNEQFSSLAQLRVRRAIATGDEQAVRLASVQFEGTEAAAETHRWLGDQALASGWFVRALAEYERAQPQAGAALRRDLAARRRLAGAMLGEELGEPVTRSIQLHNIRLTAAEFESMIAEMLARPSVATGERSMADDVAFEPALPPSDLEVQVRGRLDGRVGGEPTTEVTPYIRQYSVPWADRQIATTVRDGRLYANNRFQVAAYDLSNGNRLWQSTQPPGDMQRAQEWSLTPMKPLVDGQRIYARQLFGHGPKLVCFDRDSGSLIWSSDRPQNEFVVSDPMIVQSQLVALTLLREQDQRSVLRLTQFSLETGEVLGHHELLRLNPSWWTRRYCVARALDDAVVACLGGISVCCDGAGEVRWIRRQVVMPPQQERTWVKQYFQAPLLVQGRLLMMQPCVRTVDCLDPETGYLHWSRTIPDICRLVGANRERIFIQTEDSILALAITDGSIHWRHKVESTLDAQLCGRDGQIIYSIRTAINEEATSFRPRLIWLSPDDGQPVGAADLAGREDADPRMGPMIQHGNRLWVFFGRGQDNANRELLELIPKEKPPTDETAQTDAGQAATAKAESAADQDERVETPSPRPRQKSVFTSLVVDYKTESGQGLEVVLRHSRDSSEL